MEKEILKACKENRLYDYIANNYWKMNVEELKDVCLEAIYTANNDKQIEEHLKDRWEE